MSFLEYTVKSTPTGLRKLLYFNWPLVVLITAVACVGFLMLYSVAGGSMDPWASAQMERFALGFVGMFVIALVPIWFWRNMSVLAYGLSVLLLLLVEFVGVSAGGAQRWIDLGFMRLQPSEMAKFTVIMLLAAYYDWLPSERTSRPLSVVLPLVLILIPVALTLQQPDLGTSMLMLMGGVAVMFMAGVHLLYFITAAVPMCLAVGSVFWLRGTDWQPLQNYQYDRIDIFLDPSKAPLDEGYQFTQNQIALGAGGMNGRGYMRGTQTQNDFLPEPQTDFIFTTLAEEFGFTGSISLLVLYILILIFCVATGFQTRDRYASLLCLGIAVAFFLYFALNIAMVTGLAPVVGVPLPLVSYGGSVMLVLMTAFGLVQSAHIHRPR